MSLDQRSPMNDLVTERHSTSTSGTIASRNDESHVLSLRLDVQIDQ